MKLQRLHILSIVLLGGIFVQAQTLLNTSFESVDGYIAGTINNKYKWTVSSGIAEIVTTTDYIKEGSQALKLTANGTALQVDNIAFASNSIGLSGDVYVDFWIKLKTLPSVNLGIIGYDLGTNTHRSFMIEFQPNGKIKLYDGSSGWVTQPTYTTDTWTRLTVKIDNGSGKYQLAINGAVQNKLFTFREIKNNATSFDFHSIRFAMSSGTCDVAVENIYIGSAPIQDITFQEIAVSQSVITVNQPAGGTITLQPQQSTYENGTSVTAQFTPQSGYQFEGWSGSLSGNTNPTTFTVNGNLTIGAITSFINATATKRIVSNVTQFKEALAAMNPGDTIWVLNGNYNIGGVKVSRGGSATKPILIKSANLHGAKIIGSSTFTLSAINYLTFEGFDIDIEPMSTIFKMEGCSYVRITRNWMKMKKLTDTQTSKWITVGDVWENEICRSHHNRFDHNLFDGKFDSGAWLVIDGSHGTVPAISQHDRIDHNIFRNNTPRMANEKETVRLGVSDLSKLDAFTVVENNLFEDCDGDPEIVSVKSCKDTVRNNTFRRCVGTVCLRQGNNSVVEGNYFFGEGKTIVFETNTIGCGGVRVYGLNHKIFNNYFEGLTGSKWDAACTLTNGDVTNSSSSNSSHFIPENILFTNNTLVNNKSDIEIGFNNNGSYGLAPKNNIIANNIIVNAENQIIKSFSTTSLAGVSFSNNIMYSTGTSSLGLTGISETQIKTINPDLIKTNCRAFNANCNYETPFQVYKLTATSPAINAATSDIAIDFENQPAVGIRDIGADEFNAEAVITNGPLSEQHVGPTAPELFSYEINTSTGVTVLTDNHIRIAPNPFEGQTRVYIPESDIAETTVSVYNAKGQKISTFQASNSYFDINTNEKGILFCIIQQNNKIYNLKLISK